MIPGFDSAQHAYDTAEPEEVDLCEGCHDLRCDECDGLCCDDCRHDDNEEDPDDARDRTYAYGWDD